MSRVECGGVEGALGGLLKGLLHTAGMKEAVGATVWSRLAESAAGGRARVHRPR